MKTLLTSLLTMLSMSCFAATNDNWLKQAFAEDKKQNFNSGEFNIDAFGVLSRPDLTGAPKWGAGVGVAYFATRGLGFGARGINYTETQPFFDEIDARILFRAPLWDRVAPYGFVSGIYSFSGHCAGAGAGGGLEFRLSKNLAVFGETGVRVWANCEGDVSYGVDECGVITSSSKDAPSCDWQTVAGIRLAF